MEKANIFTWWTAWQKAALPREEGLLQDFKDWRTFTDYLKNKTFTRSNCCSGVLFWTLLRRGAATLHAYWVQQPQQVAGRSVMWGLLLHLPEATCSCLKGEHIAEGNGLATHRKAASPQLRYLAALAAQHPTGLGSPPPWNLGKRCWLGRVWGCSVHVCSGAESQR